MSCLTNITSLQKRRADNIIWNSAGNYSFSSDFKAYDDEGLADLYWNTIIGAAHKHYDYDQFVPIFEDFSFYEDGEEYEGMFWTALEPCLLEKESSSRPILPSLRDSKVYESPLKFTSDMKTEEIVSITRDYFLRVYHIVPGKRPRTKPNLPGFKKRQTNSIHKFHSIMMWHPRNLNNGTNTDNNPREHISSKMSVEELRSFMETKYGKPIYSHFEIDAIERLLCTGNHSGCNLHFTNGEKIAASQIQNGFEALSRQREMEQIASSKKYYNDHLDENNVAIKKLSDKLSNSILMYLQPSHIKSDKGNLDTSLVWKAAYLDDDNVFKRLENDNLGNISVDILLDASTSQKNRIETISSQGYIIAQSLTRCSIPCRVLSFCSMTGYTILRIFRDYQRPQDNNKIFEYVANGCNRDGLAIRAVHHLLGNTQYEHKIIIVLSDVKPNDVVKIKKNDNGDMEQYEKLAGLIDTAQEVRNARFDGISVLCIFTGDDEDLSSAKMVYDKDFVRIKSFDMLADTVGKLINNQIRNF